jgi:alpha-glucoside transport system permease protein
MAVTTEALPDPDLALAKTGTVRFASKASEALTTKLGRVTVWMLVVLWTIPTFGLLISSIRPEDEIKSTGWWTFFSDPNVTLQNYKDVLSTSGDSRLSTYFFNSVTITIPGTIIPVLLASLAAYALTFMAFKGRDWIFLSIVALLVVPIQLALIPLQQLFTGGAHLGSITIIPDFVPDASFLSIWIAHTCFGLPLATFLMKNFVGTLPRELIEAARVDGAGHLTIFARVVVPLSVPALASLTIFQFLWVWNDLLVGLVFGAGAETAPMTARLADLAGSRGNEWQRLTSGAFITMIIPLIVFFGLQRFFVRGLVAGAVKG